MPRRYGYRPELDLKLQFYLGRRIAWTYDGIVWTGTIVTEPHPEGGLVGGRIVVTINSDQLGEGPMIVDELREWMKGVDQP